MSRIKTILAAVVSMIALASCEQEIADFTNRLDDLENRVSKLEQLCSEMNSNISSLQSIVTAMQSGDYITSVKEITEGGKTIGHTITFAKGTPITIYHGQDGKDGADGHTPVVSVKQDTDGIWYWAIDGEWLYDANNQKVNTVGTDGKDGADGKDGVTPQFKIEDGYWYVSTDNGQTWTKLDKATGADGKDGKDGDSMFQSVTVTETDVTFVTADGQSFVIKRASALSIEFDSADLVVMGTNSTRDIHYTITSGLDDVAIEALSSADIKVKVAKTDAKTGALQVKTGATIDEYSKVVVLVSNGSQAIMRTLNFEAEAIEVEENTTKEVSDEGGEVTLEFFSNVPCYAVIPEEAQSWISVVPGTKGMTKQMIQLIIKPNDGTSRSSTIKVISSISTIELVYVIKQNGEVVISTVSGSINSISHPSIPDNEIPQYSLTTGTIITILHRGESYKYEVSQSDQIISLVPVQHESKVLSGKEGETVYAISTNASITNNLAPYDNYSVYSFSQPYDLNNHTLPLQVYRGEGCITNGELNLYFELIYSYLRIDISKEVREAALPSSETLRIGGLSFWGNGEYDVVSNAFSSSGGTSISYIYDYCDNDDSLKSKEILSFYYPILPISDSNCSLSLYNTYGTKMAQVFFDE